MSSRLLGAVVALATCVACLGGPARVTAKPPDLPLVVEDQYAPEPGGAILMCEPDEFPDMGPDVQDEDEEVTDPAGPCAGAEQCTVPNGAACPVPRARPRLSVKTRRTLAACLLFTAHPLLGVTPTDGMVDMPEDHPFSGNVQIQVKECESGLQFSKPGYFVGTVRCNSTCPLAKALKGMFTLDSLLSPQTWLECLKKMAQRERASHRSEWVKCVEYLLKHGDPCTDLIGGVRLADCTDIFPCGAPATNEEYCPWMQRQVGQGRRIVVVDPRMAREVMAALKELIDAKNLLSGCKSVKVCCDPTAPVGGAAIGACTPKAELASCALETIGSPQEAEGAKNWKTEIKEQLKSPVTLNYSDTPLNQFLDDIRTWKGLNIVVDGPAVKKSGIDLGTPITIKLEEVSLRSALHLVLRQAELTFVLKNEVVLIVPAAQKPVAVSKKGNVDIEEPCKSCCCCRGGSTCLGCCIGALTGGCSKTAVLSAVVGAAGACHAKVGKGCCAGKACAGKCCVCVCPKTTGCPMKALWAEGKHTCPVMKMLAEYCKAMNTCTEGKCAGCPNGCTETKCGKDCPVGCSKPCGKTGCDCHKKGHSCGERKSKPLVGGSPCTGKPCGQSCGSCQTRDAYPHCYTNAEEDPETPCDKKKVKSCPVNNCPYAPCSPCKPDGEDEPETRARPCLQPHLPAIDTELVPYLERLECEEEQKLRDLEVVTEEQSVRKKVEIGFGVDLSSAALFLFNTTCADVKLTPGQVELSWQVKLGPCVWQVRYGKAGCQVETMPTECDD